MCEDGGSPIWILAGYNECDAGIHSGSYPVYSNEIVSSLHGYQIHLYVDDSILYGIADSVQLAIERLQLSFHVLQHSLINLKLIPNANKIKFMAFSRAKNI